MRTLNISKSFPGVKALTDVSLEFYPGEVHALMGENGAGKSTLIKIISGVYSLEEGQILLDGDEVVFDNPWEALDAGISVIHQELSIAKDLTVAENIFLGSEPSFGAGIFVDRKLMEKRTGELLDFMRVKNISAKDVAGNLTAAQQQMIEIAKVVNKKAKVVVMDEPTSSLSEHEIDALFAQIDILKQSGVTVIYVSHRMVEIFRICDRLTILRDGRKVVSSLTSEITEGEIVSNMVGREIKDYYDYHKHIRGKEMLRVEGLSRDREFEDISFKAYAGEILGISGLVGAGRTEVMETIFGAREADSGKVFVEDTQVKFASPGDAIEHKLGLVTEDRRTTGLMLQAMLKNNIVLPSLVKNHKRFRILDTRWEEQVSQSAVEKLDIRTPSIYTVTENLSGGNQQKVILAKWLVASSKILILDEPTRGIDVNAKSEFYRLMSAFVEDGGCIIMVSSELPEVLGISDRILVMRDGKISGELSREDATEQAVMELASL